MDREEIRALHVEVTRFGMKAGPKGWQACRRCHQRWPCERVQLLDALEAAERSLRDLAQKADALLREIPECRCHEGFRSRGMEDPGCPYHEIGTAVIEELRDALERMR